MVLEERKKGLEEEYFRKKEKELIEKMRVKLDAERRQRESQQVKEFHWMRCPKCGEPMEERDLAPIKVDICTRCGGIYFDKGELDLLLQTKQRGRFVDRLSRLFK